MQILLLEPFYTGSHKLWADGFQQSSKHDVRILSLEGRHWKWRMHGGAISLAKLFVAKKYQPDLIIATDMLDLNLFLGLTRNYLLPKCKVAFYCHENQLTYPWSPTDKDTRLKRDNHYAFINYSSALAANLVLFNSHYHKNSFRSALPKFLKQFPDHRELDTVDDIARKSKVLSLGLHLEHLSTMPETKKEGSAVLLWNHRWEYDKNPDTFFHHLFRLQEEDVDFRVIILGKAYAKQPPVFDLAKAKLGHKVLHFGFAESKQAYESLICQADILPVCSIQDFFGGSIVEAIAAGCYPILPDRLAYPEHIPTALHEAHLYQRDEQCYQILKNKILNIDKIRHKSCYHFVSRYDWSNLASKYDQVLEELVNQSIN